MKMLADIQAQQRYLMEPPPPPPTWQVASDIEVLLLMLKVA